MCVNEQLSYETHEQQQLRVNEFLRFTRYNGVDKAVYVGHSLFFKAFYSTRISDAMQARKPELAEKMQKYKLDNAVMMAVSVTYVDDPAIEAQIDDAQILFGKETSY